MTLVSKQWICWARDFFLPHRNGTEAGILNLACSVIVILLHGGEKFECQHEQVVRAVSVAHKHSRAYHLVCSVHFVLTGVIILSILYPTHSLTK